MAPLQPVPFLLDLLTGMMLGLIAGKLWRVRERRGGDPHPKTSEEGLLGLSLPASFGFGVFLGYELLGSPVQVRQQ